MAENPSVLVLSENDATASAVCESLRSGGVEAFAVAKPTDAIRKLAEGRFDLFLVDAEMRNPPIEQFLSKARQFMPQIRQAVYEAEPRSDLKFRVLINDAEICAVFTGTVDAARVKKIVARSAAKPTVQKAPPTTRPTMPPQPQTSSAAVGFAALTGKRIPKPSSAASSVAEHFSTQAEGRPLAETPIASPDFPNKNLELDLMAEDRVGEALRMLHLMLDEPDIQLPVLPQVANEVRKLLGQNDVSFEKIADTVSLDPSMSARILEIANSPLYAGRETVRNLQQAVGRIGMESMRNILVAVSSEDLFKIQDRRLADIMTRLWMHSLACAYSNEILAKDLYIEESSDFFMMGLLHDIGKLLTLHLIQQGYERKYWRRQTIPDDALEELLNKHHNLLGARLLQKWDYDKSFLDVAYLHNDNYFVHQYDEAVVVTFFSNQLTRKMGFSLRSYDMKKDLLAQKDIAQALNMSPTVRKRVEDSLRVTVKKIRESYR